MSAVYKFLGTELSLSTANTVGSNKLVRVFNANNSLTVLAIANSTVTYANTTLAPYESMTVAKETTDTLVGVNLRATAIAYRN
jgi:hypothetical protein